MKITHGLLIRIFDVPLADGSTMEPFELSFPIDPADFDLNTASKSDIEMITKKIVPQAIEQQATEDKLELAHHVTYRIQVSVQKPVLN